MSISRRDRTNRNRAAEALRGYLDGDLADGEVRRKWPRRSKEPIVMEILALLRGMTGDFGRAGPAYIRTPSPEDRACFERCILYLKSDCQYDPLGGSYQQAEGKGRAEEADEKRVWRMLLLGAAVIVTVAGCFYRWKEAMWKVARFVSGIAWLLVMLLVTLVVVATIRSLIERLTSWGNRPSDLAKFEAWQRQQTRESEHANEFEYWPFPNRDEYEAVKEQAGA